MNLLENIRTALFAISTNKLRSLLTMLGVIIGVYAVSTMLALGQMATGAVVGQLSQIGGSQIFIVPKFETGKRNYISFNNADIQALEALPLENISTVSSSAQGSTARRTGSISLEGTTANYPIKAGNLKVLKGRYFSEEEERSRAPVIVITEKAATSFFGTDNPVGKAVRISQSSEQGTRREDLTVIGVTANQGGIFSGMTPDIGYVPIQYSWRYFYKRGEYPLLSFKIKSGADAEKIQEDALSVLSTHYSKNDIDISSFDQFVTQFKAITGAMQAMVAGIGGLSLLVGGIGIMNIMLVSVTERTREIGLRKALGARKSTILIQFLIEAVTLTALGGLIGYALSVLTVLLITIAAKDFFPQMVLSPSVAALAIGVSALIGLVFGVWPANRAANLTPIEALRYE